MKFVFLSLILVFLSSCGSFKKLDISEIRTAYIEYNPIKAINFGSNIEAKVMVIMNDGAEIDVTNNRKLHLVSKDVIRNGSSKEFKIVKHPTLFSDNAANVSIKITDKEQVFQTTDSIRINFKGNMIIDAKGANGQNGITQKNRWSRVLLREGKHGENGTDGTDGQNADSYISNIWLEDHFTHVYIKNQRTNVVWRYKTLAEGTITFNLKGGTGGSGGNGGNGGNGRNGSLNNGKYKRPGNGGDGGNGGASGSGGNGGSVQVTIHSNNSQIETKLVYFTNGGHRGNPGKAGKSGKAGTPVAGQTAGRIGRTGITGNSGRNGLDGQTQRIKVKDFDSNQFM